MMRLSSCLLPLLALLVLGSIGQAQDVRRQPTPQEIDTILAEGYPAARDRIAKALLAGYQPGQMGLSGSAGNQPFTAWLTLWRWCELLSRSEKSESSALIRNHSLPPDGAAPGTGQLSDRLQPDFAAELLHDEKFLRTFFSTLSPLDYAPLVLANLQQIRSADPAKWKTYQNLALALAVDNDTKKPAYWPHSQVSQNLVPREEVPVPKQFAQWVTANESHVLLADLKSLSPQQLKFVVDAPVAPSELDWARKNIHLPRVNFSKAFFLVKYRTDRLTSQQYTWNDGPYQLQNILKSGGICVDQAYFAMLAGKAFGIPTLFFSGQGVQGGHAWFGFLKADEHWELDCGRYATQKYATGEAMDPQTWTLISDHELQLLAAKFREQPAFLASTADLTIAEMLEKSGDTTRAAKAYESAVRTCPQHSEAWDAQAGFLTRSAAPVAVRKAFHEAAVKQFPNVPDIKTDHQLALADIARESGDKITAERIERQVLAENRSKRSDISVSIAAHQINALLDAGKYDEAAREFQHQLISLAQNGGGTFFYDVVSPYVRALIKANKKPEALQALHAARKKLNIEDSSPLEMGMKSLEEAAR